MLHGQQPVLHISSPRHTSEFASHIDTTALRTGEDTPASPGGVDTTRGATVTGYKLSRKWRKARRQGFLLTVGGIVGSHWTAIARLKLGSPRTVRCCPATVCYPHWVHGGYEKQPATSAPGNKRKKKKWKETSSKTRKETSSESGNLERPDYDDWHF